MQLKFYETNIRVFDTSKNTGDIFIDHATGKISIYDGRVWVKVSDIG